MSALLSLRVIVAVAACASSVPEPEKPLWKLPVEAAVGFAAGPLRQQARVLATLSRWEGASAKLPAVTAAQFDRALRSTRAKLSAHESAVAAGFRGPVSAKDLLSGYRWTGWTQAGGEVRLTATPHDPVERLFYSQFEVRLDDAKSLPTAVRFEHADERTPQTVAIAVEPAPARRPLRSIRLVTGEGKPIAPPRTLPRNDKRMQQRVQTVLRRWRETVSRDGVIETGFTRFAYDQTFGVETRSVGTFRFDAPNRFVVKIRPLELESGARSSRKDRHGRAYKLRSGREDSWSFDGKKLVQVADGKSHDYGNVLDPADPTLFKWFPRGIIKWMVPFARPQDAGLTIDFTWKVDKETSGEIWLTATPKTKSAASWAREWTVILDSQSFRPKAVRNIDPGGNRETVFVYTKWITAPRGE